MNRSMRATLTASALSLGLVLAGCGSIDTSSFDPTAIFDLEIFNTKKKLPGERKPVFPEGTPGVPQGVPPELVKGHKPPEEAEPAAQQAEAAEPKRAAKAEAEPEAEPKPKPKPKLVAKPKDESSPPAMTVRSPQPQAQPQAQSQAQAQPQAPAQSQVQWPDPPPMQPRQPATAWPNSARSSGGVVWPDPPPVTPR